MKPLYRSLGLALLGVWLLTGCQGENSFLNPRGEGATHIANLWWIMLIIGAVVYLQVLAFLALALFRRKSSEDDKPDISPPSLRSRNFIIANGIALPIVILTIVFGFNLVTLSRLSPANAVSEITIEVIGHRWWWEVRYPDHNIVTANEIYIPTGTQVELRLTSADVIHSLWVPALNGKTDLIPGQTNRMFLYTDQPGEYHGMCAELCGIQHARMHFYVVAQQPEDFEQWLVEQQQPAPIPRDEFILRGQQIFLGAACVYCHTVSGTGASGVIGPDLTHLASRTRLGAGVVPNTPGNLAGWIIDSQAIKPGNLMPPIYIESDDLQALLAYLETLQ
ncbi:MAG: cytochrome c oxidase subunit II [Anaerolineae bacterium]|nr:cytochrome c oxidase subunit II [Anaerolineae bacterium]